MRIPPRLGLSLILVAAGTVLGIGYVLETIGTGGDPQAGTWLASKGSLLAACLLVATGGTLWLQRPR